MKIRLHALAVATVLLAAACSHASSTAVLPSTPQATSHRARAMSSGGSSYTAAVLALSPYAYYPLNETSGTIAYDSSGNGRNGTYEGTSGTNYLLGQSGIIPNDTTDTAPKFYAANPGSPKVALPTFALGSNGTTWQSDFSVALWMKPDPSALKQVGEAIEINDYYLGQMTSTGAAAYTPFAGIYPDGNYPSATNTFADGNAHFIVQTIHRNTSGTCDVYLYVDGALAVSKPGTACSGDKDIAYSSNAGIGGRVSAVAGGAGYFGNEAGVAIFSQALSASSVATLYQSADPVPPAPTSAYDQAVLGHQPYAYYRLNETYGTIAYDSSGNSRNGTYEGLSTTDYLLGQASIEPNDANDYSLKTYATNPGAPHVSLPSMALASNGASWQSDFTMMYWIQPDPSALSQEADPLEVNDYYFGQAYASGSRGAGSSAETPYMGVYPSNNWTSSTATFADGKAHFLAMSIHQNSSGTCDLVLYVDGLPAVTEPGTTCSGADDIKYVTNAGISGRVSYGAGGAAYFGRIQGVAIFSRALTACDIQSIYAGSGETSPYQCAVLAMSPFAYYPLDEQYGTTAFDISGNGRNGIYEGTSGTDYTLGASSIIPLETDGHAVDTAATDPGAPKIALPSFPLANNSAGTWQGDFTMMGWVLPASSEEAADVWEINDYYMGQAQASGSTGSASLAETPYMGVYPSNNWTSLTPTFADGNAHFLVMTVHQNTSGTCDLNLYVDGASALTEPGTQCSGADDLKYTSNASIGARVSYSDGGAPFAGQMEGFAVLNSAMSAAQVGSLYQTSIGD